MAAVLAGPSPVTVAPPRDRAGGKPLGRRVLIGAAVLVGLAFSLARLLNPGLQSAVDAHLGALRNGDIQGAYEQTSRAFREATPAAAFLGFVTAYPVLSAHRSFRVGEQALGTEVGYVRGTLADGDRALARVEFQMVKEDDAWKIQAVELAGVERP
jgi:hypothetical protein